MKLSSLIRRDPTSPDLRERAAALRDGLNRREAVLGAAVATAVPIPFSAAAQPHPDAALFTLWQRREEAFRAEMAAAARWDAIEDAANAVNVPAVLFVRAGDDALGIARLACKRADGRLWYHVGDLDAAQDDYRTRQLRGAWKHAHTRLVRSEDNLPADAVTVTVGVPWPEAQARADEIVRAWDGRRAEIARRNEASGFDAAKADWEACNSALDALEDEIAATEARTLTGLTIKARLAQSWDERGFRDVEPLAASIIAGLIALSTTTA